MGDHLAGYPMLAGQEEKPIAESITCVPRK